MSADLKFDTFSHLKQLLVDFERCKRAARDLSTPNAEDDEFIRCSMVGFTYHASLDRWSYDHFQYVRTLRDEAAGAEFSLDWVRFCCLAGGYFLGLAEAGLITQQDLLLAEAHTPGFMWLHPEAFGTTPDDEGTAGDP